MSQRVTMSRQTRTNWLIDAGVLVTASLAVLSGIYFLFVPGYQGGRHALSGATIIFARSTWSDLHTWGGVLMIIAVVAHFAIHRQWVKQMGRRIGRGLRGECVRMSKGAKFNLFIDLLVALSFLITAVSGVYFLFAPDGGYQGGRNPGWDPSVLWSRTTWDLIHTWAGVVLVVSAVIHFAIHWRWVKNVTRRFFLSLVGATEPRRVPGH
jgi:cytochrome b subunit of formate dehydrogenase